MINQLKIKIRQKCDIRRNLYLRLGLLNDKLEPDSYYLCKWSKKYSILSDQEKIIERMLLIVDIIKIKHQINDLGRAVLVLRGSKWSF